jgi:hypothetical protein
VGLGVSVDDLDTAEQLLITVKMVMHGGSVTQSVLSISDQAHSTNQTFELMSSTIVNVTSTVDQIFAQIRHLDGGNTPDIEDTIGNTHFWGVWLGGNYE